MAAMSLDRRQDILRQRFSRRRTTVRALIALLAALFYHALQCKQIFTHGTNIRDLGTFRPPLNCRSTASGPLPSPGRLAIITGLREIAVGGVLFCVTPPVCTGCGAGLYIAVSIGLALALAVGIGLLQKMKRPS